MSFLGLNIAGTALETFQTAEDVTSENIANVQTPGASRQLVNIGQLPPIDGSPGYPTYLSPGQQGTGVTIASITRVHQDSYDALFRGATSSQNFYSSESGVLTSLQSSFGEPSNGINTAYANFQTAVQTLSNNPQGTAEEQGLLTSAQGLVTSISSANQALQTSETQTVTQATTLIGTINKTIDQIAALNGQIRAATAVGDDPNTYEDQRDQLIDTLSTYLPTSTAIQADGSTLVTVDGQALVNDTVAYHLANPIVGTNANGTPALQVDFVTPPNPVNPPAVNITGGQLGGLLDAYNNKLIPYSDQLNDFTNALASEADRISQAGYDSTGTAGGQLFSPVVTQLPISAGNIQVGILTPSEVPTSTATTAAGTLVQALNAGNTTVDTTAAITANATLANPPAAALSGSLTVNDDGINQTYDYSTITASSTSTAATAVGATAITVVNSAGLAAGQVIVVGEGADQELATIASVVGNTVNLTAGLANAHAAGENVGGNAGTIDAFINSFNAQHYGVTASYSATSQTIVFARDPSNIDLVHRAAMAAAGGVTTPGFTITDSNVAGVGPAQPVLGTPATGLLTALGANQINGVPQNNTNALGTTNGGDVNALVSFFTTSYGVPALQTTSPTAIAGPGLVTINPPAANPTAFAQLNVGNVLTIGAGTLAQENVTITAINLTTGTISFIAKNAHLANFSITSAQTSTLQQAYAGLVAQMGQDAATATTGNTTQTSLASSINQVRQSTDGINIDEETQNLVKFQNAYGAAAHVISVLASMLSDAINLGSGTTF
ncbi:MAG: flagellar hook-associated protein FlgK [Candidatus Lustribacter sp.]|jgi:flagellar hook-associated protein 1 FlgK